MNWIKTGLILRDPNQLLQEELQMVYFSNREAMKIFHKFPKLERENLSIADLNKRLFQRVDFAKGT